MDKAHAHGSGGNMRRVMLALYLTSAFMLVEVAGGILSGSLALLADAGHMLTDSMALALAAVAFRVSRRPPDARLSYGYQRFQILAAFVNGLSLLLIVGWIFVEAVRRLLDPPEVAGTTMLVVATAGLLANIAAFAILHGGDRENLNIRGAALHVAGDLLGSVAAVVAALVIIVTAWMPVDAILSIAVALLIANSAWLLVKRSAHVLLEGTPDWLNMVEMQEQVVRAVPQVSGIHHVHVWGLTPKDLMLTMHLRLGPDCGNPTAVIREVKVFLEKVYGIGHSTIEVELDECSDRSHEFSHDHPG